MTLLGKLNSYCSDVIIILISFISFQLSVRIVWKFNHRYSRTWRQYYRKYRLWNCYVSKLSRIPYSIEPCIWDNTPRFQSLRNRKIFINSYNLLCRNAFYVPGALAGAFLMDRIGRRNTQMYGFLVQAIIGFILGGALFPIQNVFPLFITMYGVFVAIGELPGSTTLLISSEVYPTSIRGKMFGLSAAFGKDDCVD